MINLRKEMGILFNKDNEFTWGIIRHLTDTICECLQQPSMILKEGTNFEIPNPLHRTSPNPECPNCEGSGRTYKEYLHKCMYFYPGYRWAHYGYEEEGMTAKNIYTIFLLANENTKLIYPNDWFFEIDKNMDGSIKIPITRRRRMIVKESQKYHLDGDKMEYVRIFATPTVV
jgi:hypothetical protein